MKFLHLSDLHIGKRVNEFSMIEDQKDILNKIIEIVDKEKPQGVIIAGDVYDKSTPSAEAVEVFDNFLYRLSTRNLEVFIISGNHDSAERLAFGNRLMDGSGIHISSVYNGKIEKHSMEDEYGKLNIFMLPFIKPVHVRRYTENEISSYTDALREALSFADIDTKERNILITHQFVTGADRSESEDISVGGSDNVDASVFSDYDYVALGHIHGPQNIESEKIRYCGTPLKYSFSEAGHKKSVTVIELLEKGQLKVDTVPLIPLHDMVEIKGKYQDLTAKTYYEGTTLRSDYVHITLTDEEDIPGAVSKLRVIYENLMKLDVENERTKHRAEFVETADITKTEYELFEDLFKMQNGVDLTNEQSNYIKDMIEKIWEDDK